MANEYGLLGIVNNPDQYGVSVNSHLAGVQPSVVEKLGQLQKSVGNLSVNSGYRSPSKNRAVGGARRSQHMLGKAIDISTKGMTRAEVRSLISEASRVGFTGIGVYGNALHFDVGARRAWGPNYSKTSVPSWARDVIGAHIENKYQGTSPAPMVAKVERQQLPAVGPVLETKPSQVAMAPQNVPTPTGRTAFAPGGVLSPAKIDVSQLSPVSSARAAPAQASPAPSMAQSPVSSVRTAAPAPDPSRFGPATAPNINEANQLRSALEAQAAQINSPAPQNVSAISSLRSLAPAAVEAPQQTQAAPSSFASYSPTSAPPSATPASYQSPAFSTAAPKVDAFGQPPAPGLQPAAPSQYTPTAPAAPALSAPRTISTPQVASVPEQPTIDAPAPDPALDYFPDKPSTGLLSSMFGPQTATGTIGGLLGSLVGGAALGPLGGLAGGLLGKSMANKFGGGLLGSYNGPTSDIGSGMAAISSVMGGGMSPGSTARASNGQTVTSLPGGGYQRTSNKYGWTEITTADGRTTRAKSTRGAGGNYGGVQSGSVRDAMDEADKAGKSGVGSSGGLY